MWGEVHCGAGVHLEKKEEETGKHAMFKMSVKSCLYAGGNDSTIDAAVLFSIKKWSNIIWLREHNAGLLCIIH